MDRHDQLARDQGYYFSEKHAAKVIGFVEKFCRQSKGAWAGKPLGLIPWQRDLITRAYGWLRPDGTRRYRHVSCWVAKKNGKTTLCSALGLYHLVGDGERGAEVYVVANDQQQAGICYTESANMVEQSPLLQVRLDVRRSSKRILYPDQFSLYRAMSSEKAGKHGYNSSCLIWDELAFQQDRALWDILRYSTANRRQPMTISISTAGYDRSGIGHEQYQYAKDVLSGKVEDIHFLPVVYESAPSEDWTSEEVWKKSNPSIGHTLGLDDFREAVEEAKASPVKESNFRTLRLNQWIGSATQWISTTTWLACQEEFKEDSFAGQDCFVGLDLARKHDLASYVLVFPRDDKYYLLPRFFLPRELAQKKQDQDHVPYLLWASQGLVTLTPGDVIDYQTIRQSIAEDNKKFRIMELGYDPYLAEQLANQQLRLEDGIPCVEVRQGMLTMGPATVQFERLLKEKKIRHANHPCLNWNAQNVTVRQDASGSLIMPDKSRSNARIDGITAAIIGISRCLHTIEPCRITVF